MPSQSSYCLQTSFLAPESSWTPPDLSSMPSWAQAKRVCIDIETSDPQLRDLGPGVRRDGHMVGIAFAIEDGPAAYLPFDHFQGGNLDKNHVLQYFKDQAKVFTGDLVGTNLPYDLDYLIEAGIEFTPRYFRDVQIADALTCELHKSYSLENIAKRRELPGKDYALLNEAAARHGLKPAAAISMLHSKYTGAYAEQDVLLPLQLLRRIEREIDDQDLWEIYNLESRVLPACVAMRRRGVRIDLDALEHVEVWSEREEEKACEEIFHLSGRRLAVGECWKAGPMADVLKAVGIDVPLTKQKKPSIKKDFLKTVDHPVARKLERVRKVNKLRTTFAQSIRNHMTNGRIHCTFNQIKGDDGTGQDRGAAYGRMSSSNPNLQQQPSRDEFAVMWRRIYVPDEGCDWACLDYSQQEPRWAAHYAELCNCRRAKEMAERYRTDPEADNHTIMTQLIHGKPSDWKPPKDLRHEAKIIFLGLCYGMGGAKLARDLGLETKWIQNRRGKMIEVAGPEAQAILDRFNAQVPWVKQLAKMCESKAAKAGYITTVGGRRCRFPWDERESRFDWAHKAFNRLIQGSSADQTKAALATAHEQGVPIQLQVHDELDFSTPSRQYAEEVADIMRNVMPMNVPAKVDVEIGPNWGDIK